MIIDRGLLEEYPFAGKFFEYVKDTSKPLDEQTEQEVLVLETKCDVQSAQKSSSGGNIYATFNVYFPYEKGKDVPLKRGMVFKSTVYGLEVNGVVVSAVPTQLGVECYIKDLDV